MTIAHFNEEFFEFARKHNIPVTTYRAPKRYGIIPCRRCAFAIEDVSGVRCHRRVVRESGSWPYVGQPHKGCGDGLLREEAAPLPPEQQKEPKP